MSDLTLEKLSRAVAEDAAIRRVRKLQPAGGAGDKLFPPTYPGKLNNDPPRHVFEHRRINGNNVLCVLIDSVQSQANRLEEALKHARDARDVVFPVIAVDFATTDLKDLGRITTLEAPHRVFDAIIRDSEHEGKPFRETEDGRRLIEAKASNAKAVFDLSPTALVFGAWNSTGEGGGLGAKFPRAVVSEIVGVGVATETDPATGADIPSGKRTGSRVDPLGVRSAVHVFKAENGDWSLEKPKGKSKEVKPSEVNHSNIAPSVTPLGVSVDFAQHTFVLSFPALRRLRFGGEDEKARTSLAALALLATAAQDKAGYSLRSRCDLVPEGPSTYELVHADGKVESVSLDYKAAVALFKHAAAEATWRKEDLFLKPQKKLVELVKKSRAQALQGVEDSEEAE